MSLPCETCGCAGATQTLGWRWMCDSCHAAQPMFCSCCGFKLHKHREDKDLHRAIDNA